MSPALQLIVAFVLGAFCAWLLLRGRESAHAARLDERLQALQRDTAALAGALQTPNARGQWGEMQLRRVVELAGMLEYCDFTTQPTLDSGRRPDLVVHLPNGRALAIDAKSPADPARLRAHVTDLAARRYWRHIPGSPEFAVAFLPGEALLGAALRADPDLLDFAAAQRVLLASPATLIALLRAVALGWTEQSQAENAAEVAALGRQLHSRLGVFAAHMDKLQRSLSAAVDAYNSAAGSFESRVLVSARRFNDLRITGEELPPARLIGRAPVGAGPGRSASDGSGGVPAG